MLVKKKCDFCKRNFPLEKVYWLQPRIVLNNKPIEREYFCCFTCWDFIDNKFRHWIFDIIGNEFRHWAFNRVIETASRTKEEIEKKVESK